MIKRSPRPDNGFLLIRNDVVRDKRLSYRARGLLCAMLSYPDNWNFNRDWLAGQSEGEGQAAVRTALRELERFGYLVRERMKDTKTGRFGWHHVVYDTPRADFQVSAGQSSGQFSTNGQPTAGLPPSKEQLSRTTEEEDEVECPHSGRFAPSVGAPPNGDQQPLNGQRPAPVPAQRKSEDEEPSGNWHEEDRALFASIVGEKLKSTGPRWTKGEWASGRFYEAYRADPRKKLKWPGRYLSSIADRYDGLGVDDWLIDQGLERLE